MTLCQRHSISKYCESNNVLASNTEMKTIQNTPRYPRPADLAHLKPPNKVPSFHISILHTSSYYNLPHDSCSAHSAVFHHPKLSNSKPTIESRLDTSEATSLDQYDIVRHGRESLRREIQRKERERVAQLMAYLAAPFKRETRPIAERIIHEKGFQG